VTPEIGKRLAVVALLLAVGGCEFLKKHVRITGDEHSPFAEEKAMPDAETNRMRFQFRLSLAGEDKRPAD
jgi:hypothetical protein